MQVLFSPFHVHEVLLGGHEEVEQSLYELGLLHRVFESLRGEQVALEYLINHIPIIGNEGINLPVPLSEVFLLKDIGLLNPQVELLVINLGEVVRL